MRSVETEGTTIDEAIARALKLLHIDRDKVEVDILESASRGVLGFGGKKARIRATVRNPLLEDAPQRAGVSRETPTEPASGIDAVEKARQVLERLLREFGVSPGIETAVLEDGIWSLVVRGEGAGIAIGRHGQTLDAIDYLLSRIASHHSGALVRIVVDVEGYRERRQESLEQQARRAAAKVAETAQAIALDPMSPRDRRIVHIALADVQGIATRSEGEGGFRRVVIVPSGTRARS